MYLPHPFVDPHRAADLLVGDGDALGLEELLEGEHGREHARVHHRSWNSGGNDGQLVARFITLKKHHQNPHEKHHELPGKK